MSTVLLVAAVVLCLLAAILGFGWFGTSADLGDILGVFALGVACGFAAPLVAGVPLPRRE